MQMPCDLSHRKITPWQQWLADGATRTCTVWNISKAADRKKIFNTVKSPPKPLGTGKASTICWNDCDSSVWKNVVKIHGYIKWPIKDKCACEKRSTL